MTIATDAVMHDAQQALRTALVDVVHGAELATQAAARARTESDAGALSVAERALGVVARNSHDLHGAEAHLRRAIRVAERAGLPAVAGGARTTLVSVLFLQGRVTAALRQADRAAVVLEGHDAAVLQMQRATVLSTQGVHDQALAGYAAALRVFRATGDQIRQAMTHNNRAVLHLELGALAAAEHDMHLAERLYTELGDRGAVASVREHLGMTAARAGRLPEALAWFGRADDLRADLGVSDPVPMLDRIEALSAARLLTEARAAAEEAVRTLAAQRLFSHLAQARLALAEVALLQGDPAEAEAAARQARRAFAAQRRTHLVELCDRAILRAHSLTRPPSLALLQRSERLATRLDARGATLPALDVRLDAARMALQLGRPVDLNRPARLALRQGPVGLRTRAWHALALTRLAAGDHRGARSAVRAGLRCVDRHRDTLSSTELRVQASELGADLALLGLKLALADAPAWPVLAATERWRAMTVRSGPARPADEVLAAALGDLRRVSAEIALAATTGLDTTQLRRSRTQLETAVRRRARLGTGPGRSGGSGLGLPELRAALGPAALVEFIETGQALRAVVVTGSRVLLVELGDVDLVRREIGALRFALRRMTMPHARTGRSRAAAVAAARHSGTLLAAALLDPCATEIAGRPLVVVPTAALHALPWAALPGIDGRPVTIAPSAAAYCARGTSTGTPGEQVVLVAGPGLEHAEAEVAGLAANYPAGAARTPVDATVAAVLGLLDGAGLAHIAAHGDFRADHPMLSSLTLSDGAMTVYDLEGLRRPPAVLVLAACDAGTSYVGAGDELIGVAAALLSLGTTTVIASLLPVADERAHELMLALHRRLRAGDPPSVALADALLEVAPGNPDPLMGFVCFGI